MSVVLATGGYDHKIRFWEPTSGMCAKTLAFGDSQVNCLEISADKSLLVGGGNPFIQIFDINSSEDKPILTYDGHTSNVTSVGFQKDLKWLHSCSEDGTVRIWDPRSNSSTRVYDCGAPVNSVALSPNQAELITGDQNGFVKIWDLDADACREEYLPVPDLPSTYICCLRSRRLIPKICASFRKFVFARYVMSLLKFTPSGRKSMYLLYA